jgi:hypothetical protein
MISTTEDKQPAENKPTEGTRLKGTLAKEKTNSRRAKGQQQ